MCRATPLLAVLLTCQAALAQDAARPLTPAEAAKKIDQQITVELMVKSSGGNRNRYLNSAADYSQPGNFTIYIPEAAVRKFAEAQIAKPDEYYYGKTIQVTGTVTLARDKPQLTVNDPSQVKIVPSGRRVQPSSALKSILPAGPEMPDPSAVQVSVAGSNTATRISSLFPTTNLPFATTTDGESPIKSQPVGGWSEVHVFATGS